MTRDQFAESQKHIQQEEIEKDMLEYLENGGEIEFLDAFIPGSSLTNIAGRDRK